MLTVNMNPELGGGFKHVFIFTPTWGDHPIWLQYYFSDGLVQPPTSEWLTRKFCVSLFFCIVRAWVVSCNLMCLIDVPLMTWDVLSKHRTKKYVLDLVTFEDWICVFSLCFSLTFLPIAFENSQGFPWLLWFLVPSEPPLKHQRWWLWHWRRFWFRWPFPWSTAMFVWQRRWVATWS